MAWAWGTSISGYCSSFGRWRGLSRHPPGGGGHCYIISHLPTYLDWIPFAAWYEVVSAGGFMTGSCCYSVVITLALVSLGYLICPAWLPGRGFAFLLAFFRGKVVEPDGKSNIAHPWPPRSCEHRDPANPVGSPWMVWYIYFLSIGHRVVRLYDLGNNRTGLKWLHLMTRPVFLPGSPSTAVRQSDGHQNSDGRVVL